jgi:hypothetical protein
MELVGPGRIVADIVGGYQFLDDIQLPLVPNLVDQTSHKSLIRF